MPQTRLGCAIAALLLLSRWGPAQTKPLEPPPCQFFKGALIGVVLSPQPKPDPKTQPDDTPVMLQFLVEKPYGVASLFYSPRQMLGLQSLRSGALPQVSVTTLKSEPQFLSKALHEAGLNLGEVYLVRVDMGVTVFESRAFVTPFSDLAERDFMEKNKALIDRTVEYHKEANRRTRQQMIDTLKNRIEHARGMLATIQYSPEERREWEAEIAEDQRKLDALLATADDVWPPPDWEKKKE